MSERKDVRKQVDGWLRRVGIAVVAVVAAGYAGSQLMQAALLLRISDYLPTTKKSVEIVASVGAMEGVQYYKDLGFSSGMFLMAAFILAKWATDRDWGRPRN